MPKLHFISNFTFLLFIILSLISHSHCALKKQNHNHLKSTKRNIDPFFIQSDKNDPYDIYDKTEYNYAIGPCSHSNCDNCITSQKCQCPLGYAQDPKKEVTKDKKSCQYKQKHQAWFFGLELIFPFGIGHFYAKRVLYGICKLIIVVCVVCFDFLMKRMLKSFKSKQNFSIGIYMLYFGLLVWQMADIICIGINHFKDGKGFKLMTLGN